MSDTGGSTPPEQPSLTPPQEALAQRPGSEADVTPAAEAASVPDAAGGGGNVPPAPPPPGQQQPDPGTPPHHSAHDRGIDEVIFRRDLNEVFLLIDFISGRSDKNLEDLKVPKIGGADKEVMTASEVVSEISKLGYPPPKGEQRGPKARRFCSWQRIS
jgi:hypothetical protein